MGVIHARIPDELENAISKIILEEKREPSKVISDLLEKGLTRDEESRKVEELKRDLIQLKKEQRKKLDQMNEKFEELDKSVTMVSKYFWDLHQAVEDLEKRL